MAKRKAPIKTTPKKLKKTNNPPHLMGGVEKTSLRKEIFGPERPAEKQVFLMWGSKGGVGATTLAIETAAALAAWGKRRVVLVDANMNGGHIASKLALEPEPNITNAAFSINAKHLRDRPTFDADMAQKIRSIMQPVSGSPSLLVLAGIQNQDQSIEESIRGENGVLFITYLLNRLLEDHDYVVVDIGSNPHVGVHIGAIEKADSILMICDDDLESLGDGLEKINRASNSMGIPPGKFRLVLNKRLLPDIPPESAEKFLKIPLCGLIPWCPEIIRCSNKRQPFIVAYPKLEKPSPSAKKAFSGILQLAAEMDKSVPSGSPTSVTPDR